MTYGIPKYGIPDHAIPHYGIPGYMTSETAVPKFWPYKPETRCTERLIWKTAVLTSADGSEQRLAHRTIPRQVYTYRYPLVTARQCSEAENLLHDRLPHPWYVPCWPEQSQATAAVANNDTTIACDTRYSDFVAGQAALVWESADTYELVDIASVADSQLTLLTGTAVVNNYTARPYIVPLRTGYITSPVQWIHLRHGKAVAQITYTVVDNERTTGHSASMTYDSWDVLTTPGYWPGGQAARSISRPVQIVDAGTGRLEVVTAADFNVTVTPHIFAAESPSQAWSFRQWLHSIYGRQKLFLVPTFQPDISITSTIGPTDTTINVAHRGIKIYLDRNDLREHIAVRYNGTLYVRRVTAVSDVSSSVEQLTIDAAFGVQIPTTALCCWADKCRLASDTVQLDWIMPGKHICQVRLAKVSCPQATFGWGVFGGGIFGGPRAA